MLWGIQCDQRALGFHPHSPQGRNHAILVTQKTFHFLSRSEAEEKKTLASLKTKALLESNGRKIKQNEPSFSPYPLRATATNWFTFGVFAARLTSSFSSRCVAFGGLGWCGWWWWWWWWSTESLAILFVCWRVHYLRWRRIIEFWCAPQWARTLEIVIVDLVAHLIGTCSKRHWFRSCEKSVQDVMSRFTDGIFVCHKTPLTRKGRESYHSLKS